MRLRAPFALPVMLLAGCAHTVSGAAVWNATPPAATLRAADTGEVLISPVQLEDIVGTRLQLDADRSRPIAGSSAVPACSALDAVGMAAFVGDGWSAIRVLLLTDGDRHERVVSEAAAVYPDAASAHHAFRAGTKDVKACHGQLAAATGDAAWKFSVEDGTSDGVRWTKHQIAIPLNWVCHGEARLRNNAVVQAMACQGDDDGRTLATTLADRMSTRVWELSGN